jgi:tetratricopeptide (TPR) repeat protein
MLKKLLVLVLMFAATCPGAVAGGDQWTEVSSSHFVVVTNASEKQARHILDQFERMRWVFQTLFPKLNVDPPTPISVFAAKNGKTFQSVEPQAYLAKGQLLLAGYFLTSQDRNYILVRLDAEQEHAYATVYHEYTHLQYRSAGSWMPLWLNEGLAEFFENTDIHQKDVILGQPSVDQIMFLRQQGLIPLPVLFKVDASSPYYHEEQKGNIFYAEAWALTHFLMITDRENKTDRLTTYLNLMAHHEDSVAAAGKAFGDLKRLQAGLENYIRASQYKQFIMQSAAAPIDEASFTVKSLSQVDADADRAEILALVQREKESRAIIDAILKADPNNVRAMETMGGIELHSGNLEAARKWYGEAVKLDSKSYMANYYFASISMRSGVSGDDAAVESSYRAAIQLNPKFGPAYDGLAAYLVMRHTNLDEASSLANKAVMLDPGNLYFRMNASNVASSMGHYADAISILQIASKLARDRNQAELVQMRIDQLNQMQQTQAEAEKARVENRGPGLAHAVTEVVDVKSAPRHPDEAHGPKHSFVGVMRQITCSYPSVMEFQVDGAKSTVKVYSNDFTKIDFTVVGLTFDGSKNPCKDFNGMKARVQYAETTDKSVDGQVFAVELRK